MVRAEFEWKQGESPSDLADQLSEVRQETERSLPSAMREAALRVEADAKRRAPVDTGALRADLNSIVHRASRTEVRGYVGNNVKYARYQEFIHTPYLGPALEANRDRIQRVWSRIVTEATDTL